MQLASQACPDTEVYSIDEAFLTFAHETEAEQVCQTLRRQLQQWLGLPVSFGIGPNKVLAKLATKKAKGLPHGIANLCHTSHRTAYLERCSLQDIWGIATGIERQLQGLGINSPIELMGADPAWIRRRLSVVSQRLVLALRGIDCGETDLPQPKKSLITSRCFAYPVTCKATLLEAISTHATNAGAKLRHHKQKANSLHVFFKASLLAANPGPRRTLGLNTSFAMPTQDTIELIKACKQLVHALHQADLRVHACGVVLLGLQSEHYHQTNLWPQKPAYSQQKVNALLDRMNHRFGKDTLFMAAQGIDPDWKAEVNHRSCRYTTQWRELPVVMAD